jgi:hypothetical protein
VCVTDIDIVMVFVSVMKDVCVCVTDIDIVMVFVSVMKDVCVCDRCYATGDKERRQEAIVRHVNVRCMTVACGVCF